jgi:hypothetical protein
MRFLLPLLFLLFTACATAPVQPQNYRIHAIDTPKGVALQVNDFYSVYYVYMNVIRAMELDASLSREEIEQVITHMIDTLKRGQGVQIVIPNYNGGLDLRATLRTDFQISKDNIPNLLLVTNYSANLKKAVEGDMQKDAYATYFIIDGDKLIKHQYVDEPKSQAELNAMSLNNLANYYLLDADDANDRLGKVMLERALPNEKNAIDRFIIHLTLSEYSLLEGDVEQARQQLGSAETIINAQSDARNRQRMSQLYSYASDIVYYYGKYHH